MKLIWEQKRTVKLNYDPNVIYFNNCNYLLLKYQKSKYNRKYSIFIKKNISKYANETHTNVKRNILKKIKIVL